MKKILLINIALFSSLLYADGAVAYKKCSSCHGANGEKAALGKSKILKDMTKAELATALNGYKDGSYGGASKAIMTAQVKDLSATDIKEISELIGK